MRSETDADRKECEPNTDIQNTDGSADTQELPDLLDFQAYCYCIRKYGLAKEHHIIKASDGHPDSQLQRINMTNTLFFPTLRTLPSSDKSAKVYFDLANLPKPEVLPMTIYSCRRSWCLVAEIIKVDLVSSIAPTLTLRDSDGEISILHLFTVSDNRIPNLTPKSVPTTLSPKCLGTTLAIRYAEKTVVPGAGCWIHIGDPKYTKNLSCSLSSLLQCDRERSDALEDLDHNRFRCWNSSAHSNESRITKINVCGACRVARYCCKICQSSDWARHKLRCRIFNELEDVYACEYSNTNENRPFERSIRG